MAMTVITATGGEEADPTKASVEVPKAGGLDLALEDADLLRIETLRVSGFLNDDDIRLYIGICRE